eukprot:m51a1_g5655 hypothetical protein (335) ;mRNA; f:882139-883325
MRLRAIVYFLVAVAITSLILVNFLVPSPPPRPARCCSCVNATIPVPTKVGMLEDLLGLTPEMVEAAVLQLREGRPPHLTEPLKMPRHKSGAAQEVFLRLLRLVGSKKMLPVDPWGLNRGGPICRAAIKGFLEKMIPKLPKDAVCLEWGDKYMSSVYKNVCKEKWKLFFVGDKQRCPGGVPTVDTENRVVCADIHTLSSLGDPVKERFDVIIATQVFEHVERPYVAAAEMFSAVKQGGFLVATAPFLERYHRSPTDYYRYTFDGLRLITETAGFCTDVIQVAGDHMMTTAYINGFGNGDFHTGNELHDLLRSPGHNAVYLGNYALFRKPISGNKC